MANLQLETIHAEVRIGICGDICFESKAVKKTIDAQYVGKTVIKKPPLETGVDIGLDSKQVSTFFCVLDKEGNELLKLAMDELNFSARAYDKILRCRER